MRGLPDRPSLACLAGRIRPVHLRAGLTPSAASSACGHHSPFVGAARTRTGLITHRHQCAAVAHNDIERVVGHILEVIATVARRATVMARSREAPPMRMWWFLSSIAQCLPRPAFVSDNFALVSSAYRNHLNGGFGPSVSRLRLFSSRSASFEMR
jgi:hypothetical protein